MEQPLKQEHPCILFTAATAASAEKRVPVLAVTPNPSIERTLPGKPVSASHVKR